MLRVTLILAAVACAVVAGQAGNAGSAAVKNGCGDTCATQGSLDRCPSALCEKLSPSDIGVFAVIDLGSDYTPNNAEQILNLLNHDGFAAVAQYNGLDIETIAFLVLMDTAKDEQEDLRAMIAAVNGMNKTKSASRQFVSVDYCQGDLCTLVELSASP